MKRTRRIFSREYKLAAVKKVIGQGLSYREVVRQGTINDCVNIGGSAICTDRLAGEKPFREV